MSPITTFIIATVAIATALVVLGGVLYGIVFVAGASVGILLQKQGVHLP